MSGLATSRMMTQNGKLLRHLCTVYRNSIALQHSSSNRCSFAVQQRPVYPRMYKTMVVLENGSTITVRLREPRKILKLPVDMSKLSEEERTNLWFQRKGRVKATEEVKLDSTFTSKQYSKFFKS
uniref:39S ribosomal protein L55, mitochondrial-like n=1 Tax=Phallusia mammillata TaxID=59560 RepID=A0A6F9DLH5_9ASCI|nr:39S ribosomal protein L55, mitochondrial-like [Phallusia mammillata]